LPLIEKSAAIAFKSIPRLAWLADENGMTIEMHKLAVIQGTSWLAVNIKSNTPVGFLSADIIGDDLFIVEMSVGALFQRQGIATNLLKIACESAKSLNLAYATLTTFKDVPWNAPYYAKFGFTNLGPNDMPQYLNEKLEAEDETGLIRDERCAMRKVL